MDTEFSQLARMPRIDPMHCQAAMANWYDQCGSFATHYYFTADQGPCLVYAPRAVPLCAKHAAEKDKKEGKPYTAPIGEDAPYHGLLDLHGMSAGRRKQIAVDNPEWATTYIWFPYTAPRQYNGEPLPCPPIRWFWRRHTASGMHCYV